MVRLIFSLFSSSFSFLKKAVFILIIYAIVIGLLSYFINKDRVVPQVNTNTVSKTYEFINDPELKKTNEGKLKLFLSRGLACTITGEACTDNPSDDKKNLGKSVSGYIGKLFVSTIMNPPASGVGWTYIGLAQAGFIPNTYAAQGVGYAGIFPFSPIWKIFRNIAFSLLVLIVITLGFLIMFRAKLDPQAVVSIENSLPRIVISMLLITFSFAIAGFLIDMMYVVTGLAVSIIQPNDTTTITTTSLQNNYVNANLGDIWEAVFPDNYVHYTDRMPIWGPIFSPFMDVARMGNALLGIFPKLLQSVVHVLLSGILAIQVGKFVGWDIALIPGIGKMFNGWGALGTGVGELPGILQVPIAILIFGIAFVTTLVMGGGLFVGIFILLTMVFLMFRVFFLLLFAYLRLLMLIIFSPLILLLEAVPGQNTFSNWIKSLISELIMFPAVIMLLIVGEIIVSLPAAESTVIWQPPFLGGLSGENFAVLVGMGLLFLIPDLLKSLKDWIGAKPLPVNVGLGTYLGGVGAVGGSAMGALSQAGAMAHLFPGIRNILLRIPILNKFAKDATTRDPQITGPLKPGPPIDITAPDFR